MLRNITNVAQISTNATYKLVNSWNLAPLSINPAKPQLQLHTAKQDEGLAFKFRNSEETGFVNICAAYQNQTWCLDVFGDNKTTPRLSPWGFYSGQYWVVTPVNGMIKLANQLTGLDYFLDVFDGSNETFMSTGDDYAGQYWMLDHVADNVTLPPNAAEVNRPDSVLVIFAITDVSRTHRFHHHRRRSIPMTTSPMLPSSASPFQLPRLLS